MNTPYSGAHWRDSARSPLLYFVDARAVFPIVLWLLHLRVWTFVLALAVTVFLTILNYYGFSVAVFGRWLRTTLAGRRKTASPWWI
ncbi:MAG: IcmT/TraK family protein [Gammaproteobacteria bacterium]